MKHTGERQTAPTLDGITPDHRKRYETGSLLIMSRYGVSTILDAACGAGYGSWIMAVQGHSVVGVDIDQEAVDFAKQHYAHSRVEYHCSDASDDAGGDIGKGYDVAVSFETIEHVEDAGKFLQTLHGKADMLMASVPNENVVPFSKGTHPFHHRHYTPEEFAALLRKSGWNPIEWYTQYDKFTGDVVNGDDGRTLIVLAEKMDV